MYKKAGLLIIALFAVIPMLTGAEPLASFDFDKGENINVETGMTEFGRSGQTFQFKGLSSGSINLTADPKVDSERLFAASPRGKAMRIGVDKASDRVFAAYGNLPVALSQNQGSVALWLCPENWEGNDKEKFRIFFAANDKTPRSNELLIYKNGGNGTLTFLIGPNDAKEWSFIPRSIWDWKPGQWHFICAAWDKEMIYLYVDGKMMQAPRKKISDRDYKQISVGSRGWKNEDGISLIDDLMIFDKALSLEEMDRVYRETKPVSSERSSPFEQKLGVGGITLDGVITDGEYGLDSNISFNIRTGVAANNIRWGIGRDAKNLYFACESPAPTTPPTVKIRDGKLWEDESIELHLEYKNSAWQFIFNEAGAFYDSHNGDFSWNIKELAQKQSRTNERWTIEVAIPFEGLGIAPEDGEALYAGLCRSGESMGAVAATPLLRSFSDRVNYMKLKLEANAPRTRLDFRKLPVGSDIMELNVKLCDSIPTSFNLQGTNLRARSLYNQTVMTVEANGVTSAQLSGKNLDREGIISLALTRGTEALTSASLKYLSPEQIRVRYLRTDIAKQMLETVLSLAIPPPPELEMIQRLADKSGQTALEQRSAIGQENAKKMSLSLSWDLAKLPPGDYDYYFLTALKGEETKIHHQYFMKPGETTPWSNFSEGLDNDTPAPWEAPEYKNGTLSCLTQKYEFKNSLFPVQVYADGKALLSSGIALWLNGKIINPPAAFEVLEKTPLHLRFRTTANIENMRFQVNGLLEYDGWCNFELEYSASGTGINDMALVVPMRKEYSELVSRFEPADIPRKYPSGKIGKYWCMDLMEHPVFWLGDGDRGLFWGADSMRGTHISKTADSLAITKAAENEAATAVVKLIDKDFQLNGKRVFTFGIQGTPVKPLRPGLQRPFMHAGGAQYNWSQFMRVFNYYHRDYMDLEMIKTRCASARGRQEPFYAFYACIYGVSPFAPEWPWFAEQWISSPPGFGQFKQDFPVQTEEARNRDLWAFGCVNDNDFKNWQLYHMIKSINDPELEIRDMYFDMAYPRSCLNQLHGCGWTDDFGALRKTYAMSGTREFTKRIRKALRDKDPDSVLMYHPSSEPLPPVCGLVDFIVDGEAFVAQIGKEENCYKIFTPELFRSSFTGAKCGTWSVYLAQFNRACQMLRPEREEYWRRKQKAPEAVRAVRHFLGYTLVHGVKPQAGACIYNEGAAMMAQLESIGWNDEPFSFHPYWREGCPVAATGTVMASAYRLPGKLLAVLLNDTDGTVTTTLSCSIKSPRRIYDLETGKDVGLSGITIPARGCRLIVIEENK